MNAFVWRDLNNLKMRHVLHHQAGIECLRFCAIVWMEDASLSSAGKLFRVSLRPSLLLLLLLLLLTCVVVAVVAVTERTCYQVDRERCPSSMTD